MSSRSEVEVLEFESDGLLRQMQHIYDECFTKEDNMKKVKCDGSFAEQLVSGASVHNPEDGGYCNGRFIGYAVELDAELDADSNTVSKVYTVLNSVGETVMNVEPTIIYTDRFRVSFEIQPDSHQTKTVQYHAVVYRMQGRPDNDWKLTNISDAELGEIKTRFQEYRIIDTWFE